MLQNDGLALVVADGAGSAARSEIGAELATTTAVELLTQLLKRENEDWQARILEVALAARVAVLARAAADIAAARDYACTLLIVVATRTGGAAFQIGDGVIAYRDTDGWAPVFWPQKGEYANTTRFLTDETAAEAFEVVDLPTHEFELAVMSDGLESLALHFATRSIHEPFLETLFSPLRARSGTGEAHMVSNALEAFLASTKITERADDDLTLLLATRA